MGRKFVAIVRKDLLLEVRGKDMGVSMGAFALMVVLTFAFLVKPAGGQSSRMFPGLLWLVFLFSGMLAIGRGFEHEERDDALAGLLAAPGDRVGIYLAKVAVAFLFMVTVEGATFPVLAALFHEVVRGAVWQIGLVFALGTLGLVGTGTLFSAMAAHTRAGPVLIPVLMLPFSVPVLLMAVEGTAAILHAGPGGGPWPWLHALMAYDAGFLALPLVLSEYVWEV